MQTAPSLYRPSSISGMYACGGCYFCHSYLPFETSALETKVTTDMSRCVEGIEQWVW